MTVVPVSPATDASVKDAEEAIDDKVAAHLRAINVVASFIATRLEHALTSGSRIEGFEQTLRTHTVDGLLAADGTAMQLLYSHLHIFTTEDKRLILDEVVEALRSRDLVESSIRLEFSVSFTRALHSE